MRFSLKTLLLTVLAGILLAGAARMYLLTALSPRGIMIAAVMGVVGFIVGRIVAQAGSQTPRVVFFLVCITFYAGLSSGRVAPGDPLTVWAFLCATGAILLGLLFPGEDPLGIDVSDPVE